MSSATRMGALLTDVRPLRASAAYRRLWSGQTVSQLGQQMTTIAIGYQVFLLTHSSFKVGLVGLFSLVPLVMGGLYGGALVDAFDRRLVALWSALGLWLCSGVLVLQAYTDIDSVTLLYVVVAVQAAMFAVNNPARSAMLPRLLSVDLLPAANALQMASFNLGFTVGPLLGGALIGWKGVEVAYTVDAITFTAAVYGLLRLPAMPPADGVGRAPGLRAVWDGLGFLRRAPNLRMTFILDFCAMILAQPRALFPALALTVFTGGVLSGASTLGVLQAAPAMGSLVAFAVSGWIGRVHRHGIAIAAAVAVYGASIALAGVAAVSLPSVLWLCVVFLAFSGAADMVSAAYRSTVLQSAAPDEMRGRLQGVFTVVVAGGPRLGDFLAGTIASWTDEEWTMVIGGVACVAGVILSVAVSRRFLAYDARHPTP